MGFNIDVKAREEIFQTLIEMLKAEKNKTSNKKIKDSTINNLRELFNKFMANSDQTFKENGEVNNYAPLNKLIRSFCSDFGLAGKENGVLGQDLKFEIVSKYKAAYDKFISAQKEKQNPTKPVDPSVPGQDGDNNEQKKYGWLKAVIKFLFGAASEKDIAWNHFFKYTINKHFNGGRIALGVIATTLAASIAVLGFAFPAMMVAIPALPIISAIAAGIAVLALGYTIACSVVRAKVDRYSKQLSNTTTDVLSSEFLETTSIMKKAQPNNVLGADDEVPNANPTAQAPVFYLDHAITKEDKNYYKATKEIRDEISKQYEIYDSSDIELKELGFIMHEVKVALEAKRKEITKKYTSLLD